jgi:hypothetical protein
MACADLRGALVIEHPPSGLVAASGLGFLAAASLMIGLFYPSAAMVPNASIKVRLAIDGSIFLGMGFARPCSYSLSC